jgi:hypothetical protein
VTAIVRWTLTAVATAWFVGVVAWSFQEQLFNINASPDRPVSRLDLLLFFVSVFNPLLNFFSQFQQGAHPLERVPHALAALSIWTIATLVGRGPIRSLLDTRSLTRGEFFIASAGLGMAIVSLAIQMLGWVGLVSRWTLIAIAGVVLLLAWVEQRRSLKSTFAILPKTASILLKGSTLLVMVWTFAIASLIGLLPTPDYDANAYHLLCPKEWFLAGSIHFLPHNMYTSFPFLTEMFHLVGMTIANDTLHGGLIGQGTLVGFGLLTSTALFITTRRLFNHAAAWLAVLVYASNPWVYRLTTIPYVEGPMLAYVTLTLWSIVRLDANPRGMSLLAGLFAGAAFGCKYPALLMVIVPAGIALLAIGAMRKTVRLPIYFAVGVIVMTLPWLARNFVWTGNPVYPLLYDVFGGAAWNEELNRRFVAGHQPHEISWASALSFARDIVVRSDWQSSLVFAWAPLALLVRPMRRVGWLFLFLAYLFVVFYFTTHRLDRFFLAILSPATILAGAGGCALARLAGPWIPSLVAAVVLFFNLSYMTTPFAGFNEIAASIANAEQVAISSTSNSLLPLNNASDVKPDDTVLFVGLAAVYHARMKARYNTVFNANILEEIVRQPGTNAVVPADVARQRLADQGIDYVFVDWSWIDRYREPGNYGFAPFITRELFDQLVREGILTPPTDLSYSRHWLLYRVVPPGPSPSK